ncbi:hypothetical protein Micbo1qcDRAFT_161832 [Microdochium bolleyi]|uniref:Uncharacterized protein n=1 Tax=Microdochium bolleyi TaxID=196109 RepID=A0A136J4B2_9PEZI|nr:hypothetical protein Micbo1qcDRAFT_161832 [Microdochium bolleyi]
MASPSSPLLPRRDTNTSTRRKQQSRRTSTAGQNVFTRPFPSAVTYDLSTPDQATIRLPPGSTWTSGPHWHDTHTEFLQVISGRAHIVLGLDRGGGGGGSKASAALGHRNGGANDEGHSGAGDSSDNDDLIVMPAVGPEDGVVVVPRGTVHEWRRSQTRGVEDELVVKEWTDPKDGQKEGFFRNLNGIILDALAAEARAQAEQQDSGAGAQGKLLSWRMRTLDLELNNLFWRMDNWPLVLDQARGWPGWVHGLATRAVLIGSVVLGKVLGLKGVYPEYDAQRS